MKIVLGELSRLVKKLQQHSRGGGTENKCTERVGRRVLFGLHHPIPQASTAQCPEELPNTWVPFMRKRRSGRATSFPGMKDPLWILFTQIAGESPTAERHGECWEQRRWGLTVTQQGPALQMAPAALTTQDLNITAATDSQRMRHTSPRRRNCCCAILGHPVLPPLLPTSLGVSVLQTPAPQTLHKCPCLRSRCYCLGGHTCASDTRDTPTLHRPVPWNLEP